MGSRNQGCKLKDSAGYWPQAAGWEEFRAELNSGLRRKVGFSSSVFVRVPGGAEAHGFRDKDVHALAAEAATHGETQGKQRKEIRETQARQTKAAGSTIGAFH